MRNIHLHNKEHVDIAAVRDIWGEKPDAVPSTIKGNQCKDRSPQEGGFIPNPPKPAINLAPNKDVYEVELPSVVI